MDRDEEIPTPPGAPETNAPEADAPETDALGTDAPVPAQTITGSAATPARSPSRLDAVDRREPLFRDFGGYRLRLDPADLARLRELAGSRGKSDEELGEAFFDGQAERLAGAVAGDVPAPAELRIVVDPYTRQAFVALENRIKGILSF